MSGEQQRPSLKKLAKGMIDELGNPKDRMYRGANLLS